MFDNVFDSFRKASESSLQMQQEMMKNWAQQWPSSGPMATGSSDWGRNFQKRWMELGLELLKKQRESLDAAYAKGIELIEQSCRMSEAKSSDEYRHMIEDLWRKLFDTFKQQSETQFRDFQKWSEKSVEIAQDVNAVRV
jgi:hypothetical protein